LLKFRLISGISEQLEHSVQGFFLTLTLILQRFGEKIDFDKFIKFTVDKTGLGQAQSKSERKGLAFGRLLVLSCLSEAGVFESSNSLEQEKLEGIVSSYFFEMARLFNHQAHFRESVLKSVDKAIHSLSNANPKALGKGLITLAKYTLFKPTDELKEPKDVLRFRISNDADYLALFLACKKIISKVPKSLSNEDVISLIKSWSIEEDSKYLFKHMKKMLIEETVVLAFPRPHSVLKYLVEYLITIKANKIIRSLWKTVFEKYCFNENQLYKDDINKRAKMSLNNVGFYTFQYFLESEVDHEVILDLLTPNFVRLWVNRMNKRRKNKTESIVTLDEKFREWIASNAQNIDPTIKLNLVKNLFGPNALRRFTFKSNFSLFAHISEDFSEEIIFEYISYGEELFKSPDLQMFYPEENEDDSSSENDQDDKQKAQANKEDNIRIYVLNMLVNTVTIFKNHSESTLKEVINFVVYQAFFQESLSDKMKEFSKDKLFALVDGLHKRKSKVQFTDDITSQSLGLSFTNTFLEGKSLWINEINKTIGRYALEGNEFNTLDQIDGEEKKGKQKEIKHNNHELKLGKQYNFSFL